MLYPHLPVSLFQRLVSQIVLVAKVIFKLYTPISLLDVRH